MPKEPYNAAERAGKRQAHQWCDAVQAVPGMTGTTRRFPLMIAAKLLDRGTPDVIWSNQSMAKMMGRPVRPIQHVFGSSNGME